jgi:hypothetical protein
MGPYGSVARAAALALGVFFLNSVNGAAQDATARSTPAPAHLAYVDGAATLEREGQVETAVSGMPFVSGDRLQTTRGRVEVLFPDGTALAVDEFTTIELQDRALMRMPGGRVLLTVAGVNDPGNAVRYQIDTPPAAAATDGPGEYRVATMNGRGELETELAVFRGYATLATDIGSTAVRAGERSLARDALAPSQPLPFNSARFDAFDRWASARRDARLGTTSSRYLPHDLYAYSSTFDQNGSWSYQAPYGNVWYPTVAAGWRPYFYGYWSPVPAYGWTWVGYDVWGWPTHHYGRWGYGSGRWFWVPGATWGGAWVSWAGAPGYVGWCPIGYCGGTGFSFGVSAGAPWGWVVVSAPYFGHGYQYPVHYHALPPTAIPPRTPFVIQTRAPLSPPVPGGPQRAIPRPVVGGGQQFRTSAQPAAGGQPATVPGTATPIAPNQPELGGARARPRSPDVMPRDRSMSGDAIVNRYVPDTRTLGGRPASAVPRQAVPAAPVPDTNPSSTRPGWYPPVRPRPRLEQTPGADPPQRAQPPTTSTPPSAGAVPWRSQPRPSLSTTPPPAFQPPRMIGPAEAPRGSSGPAPTASQAPGPPTEATRSGATTGGGQQAAPAQPTSPPAGARHRSR